jgi:dipeptidase
VASGPAVCDCLVSLTDDGVLFAKNSDRHANEAQVLTWVPATDHPPGATVTCTWVSIPQVARTHAVLLSRPWWMWGGEMGANEHGVVIGNEAVFTRERSGERALLGMDLVRLALERATRAEEAVAVVVELLERHGQGGPCSYDRPGAVYDNSYLVADGDGAFVVETAGRQWATRVVTGRGTSISNRLTIQPFARHHTAAVRSWASAGGRRRAVTEPLACRAGGPADLMAALRRHGPDRGPAPARWSPLHGGLRAPCVHAGGLVVSSQTTASWVSDLRHGTRHWATATAAPCTSLFKPVDVTSPVELGPLPTNLFDRRTLWWRHELLHRTVLSDQVHHLPRISAARDRIEAAWLADRPSPARAFEEADRLEAAWLAGVDTRRPDGRPAWVRRSWRALDAAAGMPTA